MHTYKLTLRHDGGRITLAVVATDEETARNIVMAAEGCPSRAIIKVKQGKSIY